MTKNMLNKKYVIGIKKPKLIIEVPYIITSSLLENNCMIFPIISELDTINLRIKMANITYVAKNKYNFLFLGILTMISKGK